MTADTKVAILVLNDLAVWQKLNVTSFLATGIAVAGPEAKDVDEATKGASLHP